jgi:hypothetical protein
VKNRIKIAAFLLGLAVIGGSGNSNAAPPSKPALAKPVLRIKALGIPIASVVWTGVFGAHEVDQFIKRIQVAEREAFQQKRGIWRKGGEEEKAASAEMMSAKQ